MGNNKIILNPPVIIGDDTVKCSFTCSKEAKALFNEDELWVQYNRKIDSVPKSLLIIPLLSNILPIAWALNVDIQLEEIDMTFLQSAEIIRNSFQVLYPQLKFKGNIYAKAIIENVGYSRQRSGTLFSGGVDSLTTHIRKWQEKPSLITIWGADIDIYNTKGWELIKVILTSVGKQNKLTNLFLKSNFRSMLNYNQINNRFSLNWWPKVQHGYALLGLCVPISHTEGINTIYIPSSFSSKNKDFPWGSHPLIDNNVKWGETSVVHDGYELTRQEKLGVISTYINTVDPSLQLRVCWKSKSGQNCSICEKCSRTFIGLILEGVNPNQHGFIVDNQTLEDIKTNILHKWRLNKINSKFWEDIKSFLPLKKANIPSEYDTFFTWLENIDFK